MTVVKCKPQPLPPPPPTPPSPQTPPCSSCSSTMMEAPPETKRLVDLLNSVRPPQIEIPRYGPGEEIRVVPREKY